MSKQIVEINNPALRYFGGKFRLAKWIISHFPQHKYYVEPFGGAMSVRLNKPRSEAECYNDLDGEIVNFFQVLRDENTRSRLVEQLVLTPYSRSEFDLAKTETDDAIEKARRTCIKAEMGFGSNGITNKKTGFRIDLKRENSTAMDLWAEYPDRLSTIGKRLRGVLIENRNALDVIESQDDENTLFYLDPPYVHTTRCKTDMPTYKHEMSNDEHSNLLDRVKQLKGKVIISGYDNDLYNDSLSDFKKVTTQARIAGQRGSQVRTECLWISPNAIKQPDLLDIANFHARIN